MNERDYKNELRAQKNDLTLLLEDNKKQILQEIDLLHRNLAILSIAMFFCGISSVIRLLAEIFG